ncbi:C69 family dipeptidase [bacterium]|nr:C69 family dipeptidase [bacterium]
MILLAVCGLAAASVPVSACTNFLVTRGASKDGSVMITYACDAHTLFGELYFTPAGRHLPGTMLDIYEWDSGSYLGQIPQVPETFAVVGNMNEHQVSIGETTWGGREELSGQEAIMDYGSLMYVTLQRAETARDAIRIIGTLVEMYGYCSSGESFSISDKNEAWIMEIIGKGPGKKGAVWVARRIPDGYVSAHANYARIRTFPLADGKTSITERDYEKIHNKHIECVYAHDVIDLAREHGWFEGPDAAFSFRDAYAPVDFGNLRFCEARVWSFFNRVAPSLQLDPAYAGGDVHAEPLPLWIKPDAGLSVKDIMNCMRDHYEGTPFDMTQDVGAGPFKLPYRFRPLTWEVDGKTYFNERAIATQQTGFSFVSQSRSWLPDEIGGVHWFGVDDAASTVYVPMYCSISKVPERYAVGTGSFSEFTWDAAFWVFNFVSNYAYSRYSEMIQDIRLVQETLEGRFLADQADIEHAALALYKRSPRLAVDYLTGYSVEQGNATVARWKKLGEFLIYKYLDGNKKDEHGNVTFPGYGQEWYKRIADEEGERLQVKGPSH